MKKNHSEKNQENRRRFLIKLGAIAGVWIGTGNCLEDTQTSPDGSGTDTEETGDQGLGPDRLGDQNGQDGTMQESSQDQGPNYKVVSDLCDGCGKCVNDFECPLAAIELEGECSVFMDPEKSCYWQCRTFECLQKCPDKKAIVMGNTDTRYHVDIDQDLCNCCGDCIPSCEIFGGIIKRESNRKAIILSDLCNNCGLCDVEESFKCPQEAIVFE